MSEEIEMAQELDEHVQVHPLAMEKALELAGGDASRLRLHKDGTVTVVNESRNRANPWQK